MGPPPPISLLSCVSAQVKLCGIDTKFDPNEMTECQLSKMAEGAGLGRSLLRAWQTRVVEISCVGTLPKGVGGDEDVLEDEAERGRAVKLSWRSDKSGRRGQIRSVVLADTPPTKSRTLSGVVSLPLYGSAVGAVARAAKALLNIKPASALVPSVVRSWGGGGEGGREAG